MDFKLVKIPHKVEDKTYYNYWLVNGSLKVAVKPAFKEDNSILFKCAEKVDE